MPRMPLAAALFGRFDLRAAVTAELSGRNSLLPRRFDDDVLARDLDEVVKWAAPQVRRAAPPTQENVVLARKGWRGLRPLSVLSLTDRIAYRALVRLLAESLPDEVRSREANATFKAAPLQVVGARYVLQTDVASFFQYVDHEVLGDELLAQTGEEPAVEALLALLGGVAGRRVGIPQISTASDVLGDVYVDPVRRSLARSGLAVFRYADDFRVACPSLGAALAALEACDDAVRALGLTLNERKSLTFSRPSYQRSLDAFRQREAELFEGDGDADGSDLSALDSQYGDDPVAGAVDIETVLGLTGTDPAPLEDGDALAEDASPEDEDDRLVVRAAARALDLWVEEDEGHDAQSTQDAAITQSLLRGRCRSWDGRATRVRSTMSGRSLPTNRRSRLRSRSIWCRWPRRTGHRPGRSGTRSTMSSSRMSSARGRACGSPTRPALSRAPGGRAGTSTGWSPASGTNHPR